MQVVTWNRCSWGAKFTHCPLEETVITDSGGQNRITSKDESGCATNGRTLLLLPVRRSRSKRKRKEKYAIGPRVNNNFIWASVKNWRTTYCIALPFITSPSLLVRKKQHPSLPPTVQDNWIQDRVTLEGPMEEFRDQLAPLSRSRTSTPHCYCIYTFTKQERWEGMLLCNCTIPVNDRKKKVFVWVWTASVNMAESAFLSNICDSLSS